MAARGERGQVFSVDILVALGILALLFTAVERVRTEVAKDRLEWETTYDLQMAADDVLTAIVDSTQYSYEFGGSKWDGGTGFERLNLLDPQAVQQIAPATLNRVFLSRLASTRAGIGYGWRLSIYVCAEANRGVGKAGTVAFASVWTAAGGNARCLAQGASLTEAVCEGPMLLGKWDADSTECRLPQLDNRGSCENFCWDPEMQDDPFIPNPAQGQPPTVAIPFLIECATPQAGCITRIQARYGLAAATRVVSLPEGKGTGVLVLEVWK